MKTRTITISVEADVENRFRKLAGATYGKRKGYLGKALTEAMMEWERNKRENTNMRALEMLDKGFSMGGLKTKDKSEWHER